MKNPGIVFSPQQCGQRALHRASVEVCSNRALISAPDSCAGTVRIIAPHSLQVSA